MSMQSVNADVEKNEKKKEDDEKHIQEKLEAHAAQKMNKENENLILMTQNYNKYYFENTCECSSLSVPSKILNNAKTNWMSSDKLNELRRKAHEAVRMHKVFILKGYFHTGKNVKFTHKTIILNRDFNHFSVRKALIDRGWVIKRQY
jgi:hypothetical protein